MKLNKLSLTDQRLFNRYLDLVPHELAVFSFANIFIWQALYTINWAIIEESLCIFFQDTIGCFMYLPPLTIKKPSAELLQQVFAIMDKINKNRDISRIENIPQKELAYYGVLGYTYHDKDPDYLCLRSDLALLRGNKFKSQRAACNHFIKHNDYDFHRFSLVDRTSCFSLFNFWAKQRKTQCADEVYCGMLEDNRRVIKKAWANYKQLNFEGIVVRVNKRIKAFSFGYRLNRDTFCVLYEITDLAIKGLAQFIFRQFAQELKDYRYINIMDDSGLENLRKTKLSYRPKQLVKAYIISR